MGAEDPIIQQGRGGQKLRVAVQCITNGKQYGSLACDGIQQRGVRGMRSRSVQKLTTGHRPPEKTHEDCKHQGGKKTYHQIDGQRRTCRGHGVSFFLLAKRILCKSGKRNEPRNHNRNAIHVLGCVAG